MNNFKRICGQLPSSFNFSLVQLIIHLNIILQDYTILYLTLIMIGVEHRHRVLSQMDLILMELMLEVLIMLSIGELYAV